MNHTCLYKKKKLSYVLLTVPTLWMALNLSQHEIVKSYSPPPKKLFWHLGPLKCIRTTQVVNLALLLVYDLLLLINYKRNACCIVQEIYYFQDETHNVNKIEQSSFLHKNENKRHLLLGRHFHWRYNGVQIIKLAKMSNVKCTYALLSQ